MHPFRPVPHNGTLGVFSPSSPFETERFESGLTILRGLGYTVRVHEQTTARKGFLAGDDQQRLRALYELTEDPEIHGIIAARGGYGAHRLLFDLDAVRAATDRKALIGFSDVVVLHQALQRVGLVSVHGPVVTQLGDLDASEHAHLARVLSGPTDPFTLTADGPALAPGQATGPLIGGCLAVLASLVGTPHLFVPPGSILLLEDVGEVPYRLDRMLTHLRLAGVFDRIAGIALGDFVNCHSTRPDQPKAAEVLSERLGNLGIPVLAGLPIGHGTRNLAVPLGARATLDASAHRLSLYEVAA